MRNMCSDLKRSVFVSLITGVFGLSCPPHLWAQAETAGTGGLFPDWQTDNFDFRWGPIIGGRTRETIVGGLKTDTISSEFGLGARVSGIPLIPSNPGITLEPYAAITWGNRTQKVKGAALDTTESSGSQRHWYGAVSRFYFKSFRYSLDLGRGKITYDDDDFGDVTSSRIAHDFGLLALSFLSGHYTITALNVDAEDGSQARIRELDQWLHARAAFSLLDFTLDAGPGHTRTKYSGQVPGGAVTDLGTVDASYLKALASLFCLPTIQNKSTNTVS